MRRGNAVLWITCALPLAAVAGSFLTLGAAILHPDSELPEEYHWEGVKLDRDFARADKAAALGVRAVLENFGSSGTCSVRLELQGESPARLSVRMIHATQPALDRVVPLRRSGATRALASYTGDCRAAPEGHWRIELTDAENGWTIRQNLRGPLASMRLDAGSPRER